MCVVQTAGYTSNTDGGGAFLADHLFRYPDAINGKFTLSLGNSDAISCAFGPSSMQQVVAAMCAILQRLGEGRANVLAEEGGRRISVTFLEAPGEARAQPAGAGEDWIRLVCRSIPLIPIWTDQGVVHVRLSCRTGRDDGAGPAGGMDFAPGIGAVPLPNAARYRRDMALASPLLCQLAGADGAASSGGSLRTLWRPVVSRGSGEILYYQSLSEGDADGPDPHRAREGLAAIERIGFGDLLDEIAVNAAIAELDAEPQLVLSAAISSVGVVRSWWWQQLAARLERRPDLAVRLILEVSEGAAMVKQAELVGFCNEVRRLGCTIAIAAFGAGFASVRQLVTIAPDIVKIDSGFIRRSTTSPRDAAILARLAQLAAAVGATVVADGIDTGAQADLAAELGLDWQQGHFWGAASACRPWRGRSDPRAGGATAMRLAPLPG